MALWTGALEGTQNQNWSETFGFASVADPPAGSLPSLTTAVATSFVGASATFTIAESQDEGAAVLLQLTSSGGGIVFGSTTDASGIPVGTIQVIITAAQMKGLPAGEWFENCLVSQGANNTYYMAGPFVVVASVGW